MDDLSRAWHRLRRAPSFAVVAVATLGIGIGANTAVFSVLEPLLLRSLPVSRPGELVLLESAGSLQSINIWEQSAFEKFRDTGVFAGVLADAGVADYETSVGGLRTKAQGELVSANYFSVLGVQPYEGRLLNSEDDVTGQAVVVLAFDYWNRLWGADRSVIGRQLTVSGKALSIVGVAPPEFSGLSLESRPDFYAPFGAGIARVGWVRIIGRLAPGTSSAHAKSTLDAAFQRIVEASSIPRVELEQAMARLVTTPAGRGLSELRPRFETPTWILMGVVALVLVAACASVATLSLARNAGRRSEIAIKIALGASRTRLVQELASESVIVAALGTALGLVGASWASERLMASVAMGPVHTVAAAGLNLRVLLFTAVTLAFAVLVCGLLPALTSTASTVTHSFKSTSTPVGSQGGSARLVGFLVVVQIGVSVMLLTCAGLILHSLVNLNTLNLGFDKHGVWAVSIADDAKTRAPGAADDTLSRLIERVRRIPGVRSVSFSTMVPVSGDQVGVNVTANDGIAVADTHAFFSRVSPDYFATLGIPLLAGREFSPDDDPGLRPMVVINRSMARRYFGDTNPLGRYVRFVEGNRPPMEVIGVVADAIYNDLREPTPNFLYLRMPKPVPAVRGNMLVRTDQQAPVGFAESILAATGAVDGTVRVASIKTLEQYVDDSLRDDRILGSLTSTFSVLALIVAAAGLYGVLSVSIARRTREIGIRMALGAARRDIAALVAGQVATLTLAGLVTGAIGAFFVTKLLASTLFNLNRGDPMTLSGVFLALGTVAAAACYFPYRRALLVEPATALRGD